MRFFVDVQKFQVEPYLVTNGDTSAAVANVNSGFGIKALLRHLKSTCV